MTDEGRDRDNSKEAHGELFPRIPVSTYRLQLSNGFDFSDAASIIEYLFDLGITDIYTSPYFKATEDSEHGYDITDPGSLSPELGGKEGFEALSSELDKRGMGLIADIVPNHMGIDSPRNSWWLDLMENGPSSPYSRYFDVDWKPARKNLWNKIVIPILGDQYGSVLESGDIRLSYSEGGLFINYYKLCFPVDPSTYDMVISYRFEELEAKLGPDKSDYQEAMSIVTALRHLPGRNETAAPAVSERMREKEIVKRRLSALYTSSPEFRKHLKDNIHQFNGIKGSPECFDLLHCLLDAQVYRLSFWQVSTEEINYRRFFDINSLAAIRMEDPEVFESVHRLVLRHIREGKVTGLRVDHPDGLFDPGGYFRRLQKECVLNVLAGRLFSLDEKNNREELESRLDSYKGTLPDTPFYIVGEKILMDDERIPGDWPVCGTTGYAFMNSVAGLFIDEQSKSAMTSAYNLFVGRKLDFARTLYERKKQIMESFMSSEINVLGSRLDAISESRRHTRDFTLNSLTDAIVETIACFPVYRTYLTEKSVENRDIRYIEQAISRAKRMGREIAPFVFDFLYDVLTLKYPENIETGLRASWLEFTMKFQQITGPIMAKGFEDTVFYCYNRLVSLNEVGGNPDRFGFSMKTFHSQNMDRAKRWPHTLNATSTHDSKRSEDVRARISVISELPREWRESTRKWRKLNSPFKSRVHGMHCPDPNDEYMLYQNLLGIWPLDEHVDIKDISERTTAYMIKAIREAKTYSSWLNINREYEEATAAFITGIMGSEEFLSVFIPMAQKASWYGMFNSLSQTLMKITSPGVPDFYQGTELWNLRLVDPDNRIPVDYEFARETLNNLKKDEARGLSNPARSLCDSIKDGRAKLFLTYKALNFRKQESELFRTGEYLPLVFNGESIRHLIGFERKNGSSSAITVAPRLLASLVPEGTPPVSDLWGDTWLLLPDNLSAMTLSNVITGKTLTVQSHMGKPALYMPEVLRDFPVALLTIS